MRRTAVLSVRTGTEKDPESGTERETETGIITANPPGIADEAVAKGTDAITLAIAPTRYEHRPSLVAKATVHLSISLSFLYYGLLEFLMSSIV